MGYEFSRLTTNIAGAGPVSTIFLGVGGFRPRSGEIGRLVARLLDLRLRVVDAVGRAERAGFAEDGGPAVADVELQVGEPGHGHLPARRAVPRAGREEYERLGVGPLRQGEERP